MLRRFTQISYVLTCDLRMLVLSNATGLCNGMTHQDRLTYWADSLKKSPATQCGASIGRDHVFVCAAFLCYMLLTETGGQSGLELASMAASMTYLINEDNLKWAGVRR